MAAILSVVGELPENGDSCAAVSAQRAAGDGRPDGERGRGTDPNGLATAAGLAESQKLRKAGDRRPLTLEANAPDRLSSQLLTSRHTRLHFLCR